MYSLDMKFEVGTEHLWADKLNMLSKLKDTTFRNIWYSLIQMS